jgi:hypothetical protein
MPVKVRSLGGGRCRVSTPHGVKAKNTTCGKARKQARLLNAAEHGWKPTGEKAKTHESARQVLAKILEADYDMSGMFRPSQPNSYFGQMKQHSKLAPLNPEIRPFDDNDRQTYGGAEGTPFIAGVKIDGMEGDAIADANGVQVHLLTSEGDSVSYALSTPFAQGKAMLPQIARAKTSQDLARLGLEKI